MSTPRDIVGMATKAGQCVVTPSEPLQAFLVTSPTGKTYTVKPTIPGAIGSAVCSCEWATRRHTVCSHVLAVEAFAARVLAR